jgi:hypothetical protein
VKSNFHTSARNSSISKYLRHEYAESVTVWFHIGVIWSTVLSAAHDTYSYIYYTRPLFVHAVPYCMFLTCSACLGNFTNSCVTSLLRELVRSYVMILYLATPRKLLLHSLTLQTYIEAFWVSFRACGWSWPIFAPFRRIAKQPSTSSCLMSKMGGKDS